MDSHGIPMARVGFNHGKPSKAPRFTWPVAGLTWPRLGKSWKICPTGGFSFLSVLFQLENPWDMKSIGMFDEVICFGLEVILFLDRRWSDDFDPVWLRRAVFGARICLPVFAGKYPAPQLGALQFFANGPLLQLRNWDRFGKSSDFSDFSDSSKSQGWLGHWPWQHDSMTQLSPWGLGLCQWSEVHLPRRAKVEQVEQYPKPSSFRRLKKGLPNFAHSYSLVLLYWNFQVQYWCNHRCTNVTGLWTRADKSGRFLHRICQVWARRFDQKCLRIGYLWMHWFIIMFHIKMPENLGIQLIQWLFSDKLINPAAFVEAPGVMAASGIARDTRDSWMISLCCFTAVRNG
jgi:hypothetical protein